MTARILERETNNYWQAIKDASAEVKLALISRLSNSIISSTAKDALSASVLIDEILQEAPDSPLLTEETIMQEIKTMRYSV